MRAAIPHSPKKQSILTDAALGQVVSNVWLRDVMNEVKAFTIVLSCSLGSAWAHGATRRRQRWQLW